jgi:hypothetical protein
MFGIHVFTDVLKFFLILGPALSLARFLKDVVLSSLLAIRDKNSETTIGSASLKLTAELLSHKMLAICFANHKTAYHFWHYRSA